MESLNKEFELKDEEVMMIQLDEREEFWWCTANACFGNIGLCLFVACFPFLGV